MRLLSSPFFRRLFVPYLLLIVAAVLVVGVLAAQRLRSTFLDSTAQRLRHNSLLVGQLTAVNIVRGQEAELPDQVEALSQALGCRITIIHTDGTVIADSEADAATMQNHGWRPEVVAALAQGDGMSIRRSETVQQDLLYHARLVQHDRSPYLVRLAVDLQELQHDLASLYRQIAFIGLAAVIVAGGLEGGHFSLAASQDAPGEVAMGQVVGEGGHFKDRKALAAGKVVAAPPSTRWPTP